MTIAPLTAGFMQNDDKADSGAPTPAAEASPEETKAAEAKGKATDKEVKEPQKKKPKTHRKTKLTVLAEKPYVLTEAALNELVEVSQIETTGKA